MEKHTSDKEKQKDVSGRKESISLENLTTGSLVTKPSEHLGNSLQDASDETVEHNGGHIGSRGDLTGSNDLTGSHGLTGSGDLTGSQTALNVNLDWKLGELDYEDFEGEILVHEGIIDSGFSEKFSDEYETGGFNCKKGRNIQTVEVNDNKSWTKKSSVGGRDSGRKSRKTPEINPFLKQNSFDHYTFNNIQDIGDGFDNIQVIYENHEEFETPDGVFVDYKQPGRSEVEDKSFFSSVKSKLLNLLDSKKQSTYQGNGAKTNNSFESTVKGSGKNLDAQGGSCKPEFTAEQAELADRLNFQVREFPLSSCPNVVRGTGLDSSNTPVNQSNAAHTGNVAALRKYDSCSEKQSYGRTNSNKSDRDDSCQRLSAGLSGVEKVCCKKVCKNSDNGICAVIYDGYIKIDFDKLPANEHNSQTSALKTGTSSDLENSDSVVKSDCDKISDENPHKLPKGNDTYSDKCKCDINSQSGCAIITECNTNNECANHNGISSPSVNATQIKTRPNVSKQASGTSLCTLNRRSSKGSDDLDFSKDDSIFVNTQSTANEQEGSDSKLSERLSRYYHVFREGELEKLISSHVPELKVVQCFFDHANWCVVAEKFEGI